MLLFSPFYSGGGYMYWAARRRLLCDNTTPPNFEVQNLRTRAEEPGTN
jgi:hypothetical protein